MKALPDRLLVVTDRHLARSPLEEVVAAALDGGARWVWFRDRDLEEGERRALAERLLRLTEAAGATLTIGGDGRLAAEIGAGGVHLPMMALQPGNTGSSVMVGLVPTIHVFAPGRPGVPPDGGRRSSIASQDVDARHKAEHDGEGGGVLVGVSAHSEADIRAAAAAGVEYATLSPIFETPSKPGYGPAVGLAAIRRSAGLGLPIVALGGIKEERAAACIRAGAAAVAVMGEVMRADDPAAIVRRFQEALRGRGSREEPLSRMGEGQGSGQDVRRCCREPTAAPLPLQWFDGGPSSGPAGPPSPIREKGRETLARSCRFRPSGRGRRS